jgi:DNA polymerase-3 subunit alpha
MLLNCHTYHSLRYGTLSVEDLVKQGYESGARELVLTDINTVTAIYDFKKECEKYGIKPIAGVEVRKEGRLLYIAIAREFSGIGEVNRIITDYNCNGEDLPLRAPELNNVFVIYPKENIPEQLRDNEFIGIREQELTLLFRPELRRLVHKMVVWHPVTFSTKKQYNLHRILRAIDDNTLLSKQDETDCCKRTEFFKPVEQIKRAYERYPEIIQTTNRMLGQCSFDFDFSVPRNKKYFTGSKENDLRVLRRLAYLGLKKRYGQEHEEARKRVEGH